MYIERIKENFIIFLTFQFLVIAFGVGKYTIFKLNSFIYLFIISICSSLRNKAKKNRISTTITTKTSSKRNN